MRTISEILVEAKNDLGITSVEIEQKSKLSKEAIEAVEKGNWKFFHSHAYCRGAVMQYAQVVGVSTEKAEALLARENEDTQESFLFTSTYKRRTIRVVSWIFIVGALIIGGILIVHFTLFLQPPKLLIKDIPREVQQDKPITVAGSTDPGTLLYLNNERILQKKDGSFSEVLYLRKGTQKLQLKAVGSNGRSQQKTITIVVAE